MFEENLKEAIEGRRCLYDKSLPSYRNKSLKEKAWMDVAVAVGVDVDICQSRWRSLKNRFVKEIKKKPKSGSVLIEESQWNYLPLLEFLSVYVTPRRTVSNLQWNDEETIHGPQQGTSSFFNLVEDIGETLHRLLRHISSSNRNFDFPFLVDLNIYKAYFSVVPFTNSKPAESNNRIKAFDIDWNAQQPKTLRILALDKIVDNWIDIPFFQEIPRQADKNYVLNHLDVNVPLKISSAHIKDNFSWRKSYQLRWKALPPAVENRQWISIYMERHLQEFLENTDICDYDQESVQTVLEICAPYVNRLQIDFLQPSMGERNDHIPLDYVLSNLPDLRTFRVTYCTKTIGTNFYLGCSSFSRNDIISFSRGLGRCYELTEFWLHSVKLESYQLAYISKALDKGCHHLTTLAFTHCAMHDDGLQQFLDACTRESFSNLRSLDLTNNFISPEGAYILTKALSGRSIEKLVLRLNPIESDGAAALFSVIKHLPLKELDISGCSITGTITKLFMQLIVLNTTLLKLDASNNILGEAFGQKAFKIIGFNKIMRSLDLRNTGVTIDTKNGINDILKLNKSS